VSGGVGRGRGAAGRRESRTSESLKTHHQRIISAAFDGTDTLTSTSRHHLGLYIDMDTTDYVRRGGDGGNGAGLQGIFYCRVVCAEMQPSSSSWHMYYLQLYVLSVGLF